MGTIERVRELALPVCAADQVDLVDVELSGGVLRVTVDRDGGLDLAAISGLTRRISQLLDDDDPVPGRYTLEVSSPGLERKLRTPDHFRRVIGEDVSLRTLPGTEPRRVRGRLLAADESGITVRPDPASDRDPADGDVTFAFDQIERARTVFEWGPAPKPGRPAQPEGGSRKKAAKS